MKKFTKLICLVMALLMLLSITACDSTGDTSTQGDSSSSSDKSSSDKSSSDASSDKATDSGGEEEYEHVNITYTSVQAIDGYDYTKGDGLAEFYSDKFNYTLDVTALTWSNWNERLRIWINAGDMLDVAVYNFNYTDAAGYVEQGLLKKLPDDWQTRWPNVAQVHAVTQLGPEMDNRFDGTYFLPRARFYENLVGDPVPNHYSLYMRKDWAEAVGFPLKTTYTISEVMEYGRLIKEHDPGNLGDQLIPIAEVPHTALELFVGKNSTYYAGFYKDADDGQYKWGAASDDTIEGLKLFSEAYRTGILHPEFYTLQTDEDTRQFDTQGIAGANFGSAPTGAIHGNFENNFRKNLDLDPYECINMATVLGEDGLFHQEDLINYWGTIVFGPDVEDKVLERYMDVLEFNATKEGQIILNMGIKDVDWEYGGDGVVSLYDASEKPLSGSEGKYPSMGYLMGAIVLFDDFAFDNPNADPRSREISRVLYSERGDIATPESFPNTDWDLYCFDSPSMRRTQLDYDTELCGLVTMDGDIETNWRNWVESKMSVIQPVLDELNSQLN